MCVLGEVRRTRSQGDDSALTMSPCADCVSSSQLFCHPVWPLVPCGDSLEQDKDQPQTARRECRRSPASAPHSVADTHEMGSRVSSTIDNDTAIPVRCFLYCRLEMVDMTQKKHVKAGKQPCEASVFIHFISRLVPPCPAFIRPSWPGQDRFPFLCQSCLLLL